MKQRKRIVAIWALAVILAGSLGVSSVEARPNCPMQGFGPHGGMFKGLLPRLELTDSQRQEVANVLKQHRDEVQGLRSQMMEARQALFKAVTANPANEDAVREAAARAAEFEVQLAVNRARVFDEIRKLLTAEQQATLEKLTSEFASRSHQGFHHRGRMMDRWFEKSGNL